MRGLMYHHFGPGRYGIERVKFQEHCGFIASHQELVATFDDGSVDCLEAAADLEAVGLKGRFFVTTQWIGRPGHLSEQDVGDLHRRDHLIGLHGHTHRFLRGMGIRELNEELQAGIGILAKITGARVEEASMPGGRYDEAALHVLGDLGIKRVWTSQPGHWRETFASLEVKGRDLVSRHAGRNLLEDLGSGKGDGRRALAYSLKSALKSLLGDGLYHKISLSTVPKADSRKDG